MNWRRWIPLIIVLAGIIAYHNSFMGQFIFDDGAHIHNNPQVRQFWPPWEAVGGTARPLVQWSLALSHATGEFNPFDYHMFNLIVHLLAGLTLYGVARRTLARVAIDRRPETGDRRLDVGGTRSVASSADTDIVGQALRLADRMDDKTAAGGAPALQEKQETTATGAVALQSSVVSHLSSVVSPAHSAMLAGIIALIWVVHPLNTQAVTYIIQRGESMMGLFYLLTLYCFIRGVEADTDRNGVLERRSDGGLSNVESTNPPLHNSMTPSLSTWFTLAIAACCTGMLCKEVMFTAPFLVLAYDWLFVERSCRAIWRARAWFYLFLFATCIIPAALVMSQLPKDDASAGFGMKALTPWQYAVSQPGVIVHYLKLAVWPVNLCFDYLWPVADDFWTIIPPMCAVAGMLLLTLRLLYRSHTLAFPGLWFFGILSVTSSFVPIADLAVEHRMYLPTAAVIGILVIVVDQVRQVAVRNHPHLMVIGQWLGISAAVLVVMVFVVLTIRRNADYHDAIGMWNKVITQRVLQPRAYNQIGQIYLLGMNKPQEAIPYFEKVIALAPGMSSGYASLGGVWSKLGEHEKALVYYQKASSLETNSAALVTNVGVQHAALGRWDEAMRFYGKSLQIDPNSAVAHNNMGVALNRLGKIDEALHHFRQAVAHDSLDPSYRVDLGSVLRKLHQPEAAIEQYQAALRLAPHLNQTRVDLGIAFLEAGRKREAINQFEAAIEFDPDRVDVLVSMAWILATDPDPAIRNGQRAVQLGKAACAQSGNKSAPALDVLAAAFAEIGQFDDAVTTAEKALLLVEHTGNPKVADEIGRRLVLFRQGKPYRPSHAVPTRSIEENGTIPESGNRRR